MTLESLPQEVVTFNVGERIAFKEDHPKHAGKYGIVTEIGSENNVVKFNVNVIDPESGVVSDPPEIYLATLEEIQ
jgi:hypothetical protein